MSRAIFQDFYPGKSTFGASVQNGWTKNFEIMFFEYLTKNLTFHFLRVVAVMFSVGETTRRPIDLSLSISKNNVFWVH